jgi:tRNA(Ile)-lysidine synthase
LSCEYSRNYIRSELIPRFKRLNSNPELSVNRLSENLRGDNDFIESYTKDFYEKYSFDGKFKIEDVKKLHFAPFSRFIILMANKSGVFGIESVHIKKIYSLLDSGNFKISLPGDAICISEGGFLYISENSLPIEFFHSLSMGENVIEGFSDLILVSEEKIYDSYSNVYKIEIQAKLSFDIIKNGFFVRNKKDGDSYKFGGMTRKLKKLFNDKTVPPSKRNLVPVFCDSAGIAWVPGFRVRDEKTDRYAYVAILRKRDSKAEEKTFYIIK